MRGRRLLPATCLTLVAAALLLPTKGAWPRWTPEVAQQFAQLSPEVRKWFRNQSSPKTGINCCSEADGNFVEEDIRYDDKGSGHYWIRFDKTEGEWMEVPDDVVIRDPNRNGAPVVWWYYESGMHFKQMLRFRCYAPGTGA